MLFYPHFPTLQVCVCVSVCLQAIIIVHGILLSCFRTKHEQSVSCSVSVKHEESASESKLHYPLLVNLHYELHGLKVKVNLSLRTPEGMDVQLH